jgi:hypothetical protein
VFGTHRIRLIARERCPGLRERRGKWPGIDLEDLLPRSYDLAFGESGREQLPGHKRRHLYGGKRHDRADRVLEPGDVFLLCNGHAHRRRLEDLCLRRGRAENAPRHECKDQKQCAPHDDARAQIAPLPLRRQSLQRVTLQKV